MSAINLKSITGITSITTPAGVDNQLTLHTNDTTQRVKVTQSGIEVVGIATFQDIDVDGHTNLDNVNIAGVTSVASLTSGRVVTVGTGGKLQDSNNLRFISGTGQLIATSFLGNGASLTYLNASTLASGTVPIARLGSSGTKNGSTFLAGDNTFKTISGVTINNNADNRLITGSGTANTLNGESGLTYDGSSLKVGTAVTITSAGAGFHAGIVTASAFKLLDGSAVGGVTSDAQYNTIGGTNAGDSFSGTSAVQNTLFGYNAGTAITSGDYHTLVGYEAGKSVTTSEQITAIGWKAATNVTTGEMNAAIGSQCLFNVTTGSKNTAVGLSGRGITTADSNTFVGHLTGDDTTTGGSNTALGASARCGTTCTYNLSLGAYSGSATCTGSHNIAAGYASGNVMTSAQGNVFLGYEAGKANTSADHNIGIGYRAMIAATTGGSNQCIGEMSLYSLTTGNSNIAMGIYAGGAITSGTQNVSLGRNAGDIITTGSNNICLGYQADASANNVSNEVTIGNSSITRFRIPGLGLDFNGANFDLGDNKKIRLGTGNDLKLYHNGTDSYIDNGTGNFYIRGVDEKWLYIQAKSGEESIICKDDGAVELYYDNTKKFETTSGGSKVSGDLDVVGHAFPNANNTYDLGTSGNRWRNLYINDLQLSNEGSTNDVDGTWGDWTLQEGEDKIFMINNRTGKKYSLKMEEQ
tara:strand:+ start:114 stop:2198 length:2085 start_codon:yes stop_codon:yes gene_type:complete